MRLSLLAALLLSTAASAGTIYRWVDAKGTVHYTDDPSSAPAGVKVTTTEGEELTRINPDPPAAKAQVVAEAAAQQQAKPTSDEEYWRKEFRTARDRVRTLEDELAVDQRKVDDPSRMAMNGNYYCAPQYYLGGPGVQGGGVQTTGIGVRGSVPLGPNAGLTFNANSTYRQNVYPSGYGYGAGPCWYQMDGESQRTRDRIERTKAELARAKDDLADLERRAAYASVPLEWRR